MQKHFYIPPKYDMVAIKRDAFKDMASKHKYWKYEFKAGLQIQRGDTPATVKARVDAPAIVKASMNLRLVFKFSGVILLRDAFKDMGGKHKYWKYEFKAGLQIQRGDTSTIMKARVGELMLSAYNSTNVDILLVKWCSEENQVSKKI